MFSLARVRAHLDAVADNREINSADHQPKSIEKQHGLEGKLDAQGDRKLEPGA